MINGNDIERLGVLCLDRNGRLVKGSVDGVNWDRVVGVGGIARDIADDRQCTLSIKHFACDERRNLGCQVDAVYKDIYTSRLTSALFQTVISFVYYLLPGSEGKDLHPWFR